MSGARKLQSKFVGFLFYYVLEGGGGRRTVFWGIEKKSKHVIFGWWWFGSVGLDCIIFPFFMCIILFTG